MRPQERWDSGVLGADWGGQASPPEGEQFTAISGGSGSTCALREDGSPVCWGHNEQGQASPPVGEVFSTIRVGSRQACGLRLDGSPVCWGDNTYEQWPPEGERLVAIDSSWSQTCGIREDGSFACWGRGQDQVPQSRAGERFTAVTVGVYHVCTLRDDGTAYCWGGNPYQGDQPDDPAGPRMESDSSASLPATTIPAPCGTMAPSPAGASATRRQTRIITTSPSMRRLWRPSPRSPAVRDTSAP